MRYLLILTLFLSACTKEKRENVSEVTQPPEPPSVDGTPGASAAPEESRVKVSDGPPVMIDSEGWVGPRTAMSGAWERELHNCMEAQTALPKATYEAATDEERAQLSALHGQILTQWDNDKRFEKEGCEAAFKDLPTLAECTFDIGMTFINPGLLSEKNRALVEEYGEQGTLRFNYRYYNPRTAVDEPLFHERCVASKGVWTSVSKASAEYNQAVQLYADRAGRTGEDAPPAPSFDPTGAR